MASVADRMFLVQLGPTWVLMVERAPVQAEHRGGSQRSPVQGHILRGRDRVLGSGARGLMMKGSAAAAAALRERCSQVSGRPVRVPGVLAPQRQAGQRPPCCVSDMRTSFQLWGQDASGAFGPKDSLLERDANLAALKGEELARPHREVVPQ